MLNVEKIRRFLNSILKVSGIFEHVLFQNGSKLYLCSSDGPIALSKITVTSNGRTVSLDQLLVSSGFLNGWSVNSDLTISTSNTPDVTNNLGGIIFISTRQMARDPNFLVYSIQEANKVISRPTNSETTLVLLNSQPNSCRISNIAQPDSTKLFIYHGIPEAGYNNSEYQATASKLIFTNPIKSWPSGNT